MASGSQSNFSAMAMRTWCLGLLLVASLRAAQAQFGAYGEAEASGSYGYGSGAYGYAASSTNTPPPNLIWAGGAQLDRRLLADDLLVQPTASFVPDTDSTSSDSSISTKSDIIPTPLPTTKSWDSATAQNWDNWFQENFGSDAPGSTTDVGRYSSTGAYGLSSGVGQYGYGGSEGSYGTTGAHFDYKSNKAYIPAVIQGDEQQQPIKEQAPGAIPDAVTSSSSRSSYTAVNVAQLYPTQKPAIGGVSRGRGTAIRQSRTNLNVPGQQQHPESAQSLRFDLSDTPIQPVSPADKVLGRALKGLGRKLRMNKQAAEEVLWAFRQ